MTMKASARSKKSNMARTDLFFVVILLWSFISTTLLIKQFHRNSELERQLSASSIHRREKQLDRTEGNNERNNELDNEQNNERNNAEPHRNDDPRKSRRKETGASSLTDHRLKIEAGSNQQRQKARQGKGLRKQDSPLADAESSSSALQLKNEPSKIVRNANNFPFTRSTDKFISSKRFFVYIVQSLSPKRSKRVLGSEEAEDDDDGTEGNYDESSKLTAPARPVASSLKWSEIRWKDLVLNWDRNTTFSNIMQVSSPLIDKTGSDQYRPPSTSTKTKFIIHCLPKTASTTLRKACYDNLKKNCRHLLKNVKKTADPYGYRSTDELYHAINECPDVHHFCVQGGDADMTIVNYGVELKDSTDDKATEDANENSSEEENDSGSESRVSIGSTISTSKIAEMEPMNFVHLVPFRNFDDWSESALKQIYLAAFDASCTLMGKLLEKCLGYRELYLELYPKAVLALQIGMALSVVGQASSDGDGDGDEVSVGRRHQHHFILYNYEDTENVVTDLSHFFRVPAMAKTDKYHKGERSPGTCPNEMLQRFHECNDDKLKYMDAIRNLVKERKRRRTEMKEMKRMLPPRQPRKGHDEDREDKGDGAKEGGERYNVALGKDEDVNGDEEHGEDSDVQDGE